MDFWEISHCQAHLAINNNLQNLKKRIICSRNLELIKTNIVFINVNFCFINTNNIVHNIYISICLSLMELQQRSLENKNEKNITNECTLFPAAGASRKV